MLRTLPLLFLMTIAARAQEIDYARDVLPILSENCYHCHGPDDASRKAGLRLDTKEGAFKPRKKTTTITPGKSGESELIRRTLTDDDDLMPPADSNRKLTAKQKETLKKWVEQGAKWGTHWAYVPLPKSVPVPKEHANPIDAFVRAKLKQQGLSPSPPATKEAWLRRVTFDLTGLPPTLAEIDAFLKDDSPQAFEKVVDRLLASPRYGERMASDWLDLARFADTYGYQHDRPSPMWPYRDWVIKAFNNNARYDEFLTHQLAGDLVKSPTQQTRLATAFNRLHMQNEEGGIVEEEFRVAYVSDRVNTMGTAFLAQTFECCRCHDHKYDPLTQRDYYSMFAFFQNIDEAGQTSYFTNSMNTPTMLLTTPEQLTRIDAIQQDIKQAEEKLRKARKTGREDFEESKHQKNTTGLFDDWQAVISFDVADGMKLQNYVTKKPAGKMHDKVLFSEAWKQRDGKVVNAANFNGENGFDIPGIGQFTKSDVFSIIILFKYDAVTPRSVILHNSKAAIDAGSRGYELVLEDGHLAFGLHHMWPGNSIKVRTRERLEPKMWHRIVVSYDGSSRANGIQISDDAPKPFELEVIRDRLTKDIVYGRGETSLSLGYRFRDNGFKGGMIAHLSILPRFVTRYELYLTYGGSTVANFIDDQMRYEHYLEVDDKAVKKASQELAKARREMATFVEPIPEIMVMDELPKPIPAFILKRGAYDQRGDAVSMSTPSAMPAFDPSLPRNRLGLARWLTANDHPLTARVQVNRLWQQMFARGLVETSDNFGTTGTPPSHPELLDWLARDFIDHGWDIKRTLKMITLSETYRQSSRTTNEVRAKDPYNHWLSHAPARKLTAEMLRDQALFASGLLHESLGGPSVYPVQPAGLWNDAMGKPKYPQSKGNDLHRRSLYTFWKRTAPPPGMTTFDAADRSNCSARRQSTTTPLQALVLLNDPQYLEAARMLAEQAMKQDITWAFRTVTSRTPTEAESKVMQQLLNEQRAIYKADSAAAGKLLQSKTPDPELAAYTQLMLTLLNLDEAVQRR